MPSSEEKQWWNGTAGEGDLAGEIGKLEIDPSSASNGNPWADEKVGDPLGAGQGQR